MNIKLIVQNAISIFENDTILDIRNQNFSNKIIFDKRLDEHISRNIKLPL